VKSSNLRQLVHERMAARSQVCGCIRCREIRGTEVLDGDLHLVVHEYDTAASREQFIGLETAAGKLTGFLRLSLPHKETCEVSETSQVWDAMPELRGAAMIREVHVYGPALSIGAANAGEAQHLGLGRCLIDEAKTRAVAAGYDRLAVISAIGTRRYYEPLTFERGELYMIARL
jgi:elongator complex protein 3